MTKFKTMIATLRPWQAALCLGVFVVTFVGALALAYSFGLWNKRKGVIAV